jgi:hypothetical protein
MPVTTPVTGPVTREVGDVAATKRVRRAAVAGLLLPLPTLAVSIVILAVGENLRQYGIPWLFAVAVVLLGTCLGGVHELQAPSAGRLERAGHALVRAGLAAVATFFVAIGLEDAVDWLAGTGRFLSDHGGVTAAGTLLASIASLVVLPLGLTLFGVGTAGARALPGATRWLPLGIPAILLVGPAVASTTGSPAASIAWASLLALDGAALGVLLGRARFDGGRGVALNRHADGAMIAIRQTRRTP